MPMTSNIPKNKGSVTYYGYINLSDSSGNILTVGTAVKPKFDHKNKKQHLPNILISFRNLKTKITIKIN